MTIKNKRHTTTNSSEIKNNKTMAGSSKSKSQGSKRSTASTASASLPSTKKRRDTANRTKSEDLGQDSDASSIGGTQVKDELTTPPKILFMSETIEKKIMGTEITVSTLVGNRLFPQIKFICDPRVELEFNRNPKSICGVVLGECNPPANVAEEEWWDHARKWIGRNISVLRNSKNTQMKWSFMGKCMRHV
jgi:hypothetical protein